MEDLDGAEGGLAPLTGAVDDGAVRVGGKNFGNIWMVGTESAQALESTVDRSISRLREVW